MPNTNCLAGMDCPKCGSEGPFNIVVTTIMEVSDDGTNTHEDTEWDYKSYCKCTECGHEARVWNFTISHREVDKVEKTKPDNLPLLIGSLTTDEGKKVLEERMKSYAGKQN